MLILLVQIIELHLFNYYLQILFIQFFMQLILYSFLPAFKIKFIQNQQLAIRSLFRG